MCRALIFVSLCLGIAHAEVADPKIHPFADPAGGREGKRLAGEMVNEKRLYDFYARQASYYMALSPGEVPEILPGYPGLDAGQHGHWGKHNQNNHEDGRWNEVNIGSLLTHVTRCGKDLTVLKGINVKLDNGAGAACFDPLTLSYRAVWKGGFLKFNPFRWGSSRNAEIAGEIWLRDGLATMKAIEGQEKKYMGFYRHGEQVVFHYRVGTAEVLDYPEINAGCFVRTLHFLKGGEFELELNALDGLSDSQGLVTTELRVEGERRRAFATAAERGAVIRLGHQPASVNPDSPMPGTRNPADLAVPGPLSWPQTVKTKGERGKPGQGQAYVVDTLPVPYENPFNSVMQLTGIAFDKKEAAYVTTLCGEVWRVTGIDAGLKKLTWKRYASGFNQPVGIHIDKDGMFVLDRGQIYRLHDFNNDNEADYYENYANDFGGYDRSHSHTFGLHRTEDGSFHFTQRESILVTNPQRVTSEQGWGVRNCMGIGGAKDYFWVAPQEGTWTPASSIIEVNTGEFYGLPSKGRAGNIAAPLCFIPRGVDNSVGGMLEITSRNWGPYQGSHVGLSYGSGLHYLILRDDTGARPQGAVVPLPGEFLSGSMRGAFHPRDGQLYLVGMDGWGDYSLKDGCFHRVRYLDLPSYHPQGFRVHSNGIRIDFPRPLDAAVAQDAGNFFAQAWNYEFAKRYGSPEFSAADPTQLGHDRIEVRSVKLIEGVRSIFVEMPMLEPVMQLHIHMKLKAADGTEFDTDLFASPMYPSEHYAAEGLTIPVPGKLTAIALRNAGPERKQQPESGEKVDGARELVVEAVGGLQYEQKELTAKPGEALALRLKNTDVMPHNLVIVAPDAVQKVGQASFGMLNDPDAGKKNYAPDLPEVLHVVPVINPGTEHVLHFKAPDTPGDYPYICTFPGHWQAMRGVLKIR